MIMMSEPRQNIYKLLDQVLETGVPIEIERQGRRLRIVPVESAPKLDRVVGQPDYIVGDPEDLVHTNWSDERHP